MADVSDQAEQLGRRANDHEWMDRGVRFGMVCYGVVYLLVAWLALQLALGHQGSNASNKGAIQLLASSRSARSCSGWSRSVSRSSSSGAPSARAEPRPFR